MNSLWFINNRSWLPFFEDPVKTYILEQACSKHEPYKTKISPSKIHRRELSKAIQSYQISQAYPRSVINPFQKPIQNHHHETPTTNEHLASHSLNPLVRSYVTLNNPHFGYLTSSQGLFTRVSKQFPLNRRSQNLSLSPKPFSFYSIFCLASRLSLYLLNIGRFPFLPKILVLAVL